MSFSLNCALNITNQRIRHWFIQSTINYVIINQKAARFSNVCFLNDSPGFRSSDPTQSENRGHPGPYSAPGQDPSRRTEAAGLVPPQRLPPSLSLPAHLQHPWHSSGQPDHFPWTAESRWSPLPLNFRVSVLTPFQPARQPLNNNNKSEDRAAAVQCCSGD